MQNLIIKKTEETPAIIFNPDKGVFQFVGTSWPENAKQFYDPVNKWINNYFLNSPLDVTVFQFRLEYLNTASSKQIAKILSIIKMYNEDYDIKIQWFYEEGDFDMSKEGRRFAQILDIDVELIQK